MPDYSTSKSQITVSSFSSSVIFIPSGSKTDPSTAISASIPQILAITCSSNFENRLTKLSTINAFGIITLASSSNDTRIILRYLPSASLSANDFIREDTNPTTTEDNSFDLRFSGSKLGDTIVDIPLNNNDDSFVVAYRTVEALNNSGPFNISFSASLEDDGSGLALLSASVGNMSIGSGFQIRNSASLKDGIEGKFLIHSLRSGAVANPDFSGTQTEVGGMQIGTSFKIGSSEPTFTFHVIQSGSGVMNQSFFAGKVPNTSASLIQRIDPIDNKSFEFFIPSQSVESENDLIPFYISASKASSASLIVGIGTKDPVTNVDIRADEFQISKITERKGIRINKEGNVESFDKSLNTASTGSEFILNYSRGIAITAAMLAAIANITVADDAAAVTAFNALKPDVQQKILFLAESSGFISPPQTGDTLGSIRWVAESGSVGSYDKRTTGETAVLKAVVSDINATGVQADLIFSVAGKTGAAEQKFLIDAGDEHQITGSLNLQGNLQIAGFIKPRGFENSQTRIDFGTNELDIDFYSNTSQILKLSNAGIIFNDPGNGIDFRVEGANDESLIFGDASVDRVGIGTLLPQEKLHVEGNIIATGNIIANQYIVSSSVSHITQSFSSGSTIFGDDITDTHKFSGSLFVSGSLTADSINGGSF